MNMRVSTSEALTLGQCERRHMYAFHPDYNLEPKSYGLALNRGIAGHEAVNSFFETFRTTASFDKSREAANLKLLSQLTNAGDDTNRTKVVGELIPLLGEYFDWEGLTKFLDSVIILSTEEKYETVLSNDVILPIRVDMLVKYEKGQYKGETTPIDFKFTYNFWDDDDFRMNSQFPNYMRVLRATYPEVVISRGMVNQIRYRDNAVEKFRIDPIKFSRYEIENIIENHMLLAERAIRNKTLPVEEAKKKITRTLSKYSCDNCPFKLLCKAELTGGNTKDLIRMHYQHNSYGYNNDKENTE